MEKASQLTPGPDGRALLSRQSHKSPQVGAKGGLELRSRQDLRQPQGLAAVSRAEWQVAPNQHIRGPGRLGLVPLLGEGGSRAREQAPGSQWPTQGGAARPPRAREGHGAAVREKRQELLEQQAWCPGPGGRRWAWRGRAPPGARAGPTRPGAPWRGIKGNECLQWRAVVAAVLTLVSWAEGWPGKSSWLLLGRSGTRREEGRRRQPARLRHLGNGATPLLQTWKAPACIRAPRPR